MRALTTAVVLVAVGAVACFDPALPPGALVLCRSNAECPIGACDATSHTCGTGGPVVIHAEMAPAFAKAGAAVVLTLDTDHAVAAAPAPVLTFAGGVTDPGFAVLPPDGASHARFALVVADTVADGFYTLTTATLSDAAGAVRTSAADAVLFVDRSAPIIDGPRVDDGDGLAGVVLADVAPHDHVDVSFAASEELDPASLDVRVGNVSLTCAPPAGLAYACHGTLTAGDVVDGNNTVSVGVTDRAGNAARAEAQVAVDVDAPSVNLDSVQVTVNGRHNVATVSTGDRVHVELLASEPLTAPPALVVDGTALTLVEQQGTFFAFDIAIGRVTADGDHDVVASLVDVVGHATVAQTIATLGFVAVPLSPCTVPAADVTGSTCTDFDGDGFLGPSVGCSPNPVDCNDADPTVHPGVPEIPGNGKDDGCTGGGDAPADDDHVAYVDPINGRVGAAGTRADPFVFLGDGDALAAATGRVVFLAVGTSGNGADFIFDAPVVGGLDPATWLPSGARTALLPSGVVSVRGGYLSGIATTHQCVTGGPPALLVDSSCDTLSTGAPVTSVGCDTGDVFLFGNADGSRILRGTMSNGFLSGANLLLDRMQVGAVFAQSGSDVAVTNSVLFGDHQTVADCLDCAALTIFHSNLRGGALNNAVVAATGTGDVTLGSNNITGTADRAVLSKNPDTHAIIIDNVIDQSTGNYVLENGGADVGIDIGALDACAWLGCTFAAGNRAGTLSLAQDQEHLSAAATVDPSLDSGTSNPLAFRAPSTVAGDIDGECRYHALGGLPDVGMDEVP